MKITKKQLGFLLDRLNERLKTDFPDGNLRVKKIRLKYDGKKVKAKIKRRKNYDKI